MSAVLAERPVSDTLLEVSGLVKHFEVGGGLLGAPASVVRAVDGVDFTIRRGETLGLVGESGCGKTTTGRCVLQLEQPTRGRIVFEGKDITGLSQQNLRQVRRRMQVIFQDPYSSLNPRMTVGEILAEPIKVHGIVADPAKRQARVRRAARAGRPAAAARATAIRTSSRAASGSASASRARWRWSPR